MICPDSPDADLAVVGAGFSGTLLLCQLFRRTGLLAPGPVINIVWIERSGEFGRGLAYGTNDPLHRLNVSAGAMSAWPDDPSHLLRWLGHNREALAHQLPEGADASCFLPRQIYGLYLQAALREAEAEADGRVQVQRISTELVDIERVQGFGHRCAGPYRLQLGKQQQLTVRSVVLAWGNSGVPIHQHPDPSIRHGWVDSPTADVQQDAAVALIGTGLTMVDMVTSLVRQGHRGPIIAISRRGHCPQAHRKVQPYRLWLSAPDAPTTVLGLWRCIRSEVLTALAEGYDWRSVIDSLRPITQALWLRLDNKERERFLRHAAVVWDVHRHRIAPDLHALLSALRSSGQLRILAGQVLDTTRHGDQIQVTIRRRGQSRLETLAIDRVILCTGIPLSYGTCTESVIARMRSRGLLQPDRLGLGAACTSNGALLDGKGAPQRDLFTLGSPRKGDLWESVAVPELRDQAQDLAQLLLASWPERMQMVAPTKMGSDVIETSAVTQSKLFDPFVRQLFDAETSTYTYLIADTQSGDAVLIDPVLEQLDRDLDMLNELNLNLRFCLETHLHADHITAAGQLRRRTGCRLIVPADPGIRNADQLLKGGEQLPLGSMEITVIATPGHTAHHVAYRLGDSHLFSGDALLIRGCGRTDLQGGDASQLYDSLQLLLELPDGMGVYPCHDYRGRGCSSIGEERRLNPRLQGRSREAFIALMASQRLAPPRRIYDAVPANQHLGDYPTTTAADFTPKHQELELQVAEAMEETNREIYNDFIGMYI